MTRKLALPDIISIAKNLEIPDKAFIDGKFVAALSGRTLATVNPATGDVITHIAACNAEDVDVAVASARRTFENRSWCGLPPAQRKKTLLKLADLIESQQEQLAVLESLDSGKPVGECLTGDIPDTINTLRWHAEAIDKLYEQIAPAGDKALAMIVREPVGVVGCVLPWNFPLLMLAWKIGPALAAGCSVVVKPAEQTSLTSLRVALLAYEAGIPAGVLNIITGTGPETGKPIGLHNDVDMVSFTGSTITGRRFLRYAADSNLKKVVLECGGKNPAIVFDDAENLSHVADQIVNGAYWNMGENCSATSRLLVDKKIKDQLLEIIVQKLSDWKMGNPLDPSNRLGALISQSHFEKVSGYLDIARREGLIFIYGGQTEKGAWIQPTIIDGVTAQSALFREEIFGPILCVTTFGSQSEAIALANDCDYGLAASVYTSSLTRAVEVSRAIRAGTVTVNCYGEGDATTPFGGYKQSGFGGRDKSLFAHDQYTELKTIWIDISSGETVN